MTLITLVSIKVKSHLFPACQICRNELQSNSRSRADLKRRYRSVSSPASIALATLHCDFTPADAFQSQRHFDTLICAIPTQNIFLNLVYKIRSKIFSIFFIIRNINWRQDLFFFMFSYNFDNFFQSTN